MKSLRSQCIDLLTEIEARLDFDDEMPPLDLNFILDKINSMSHEVGNALDTANYDKFLQSGLQVNVSTGYSSGTFWIFSSSVVVNLHWCIFFGFSPSFCVCTCACMPHLTT